MIRRLTPATGAVLGAVWGSVAVAVHLAMFRGLLPAPPNTSPPVAVLLYVADAPFLAAIYLSSILGRRSPSLTELALEAVLMGAAVSALIAALVSYGRAR